MEEENPRRHRRGAAFFLCCWMRSSTRPSMSKLGECPSAEARQLKAMHGICNKENGAKPNRAAEKHQAPERLTLISRHRAASLPCAGHTSQDTPRASGAEGRKPQSVKRPLRAIPVEVRHGKGIHLPDTSPPSSTLARRCCGFQEQQHETTGTRRMTGVTGGKALHKQIYSHFHPHKHP